MIGILDLFAGIGGFSYGLESTGGFRTVGLCEIEPFPREVLAHHWPEVWLHDDVRTLTGELVRDHAGEVDLVCGGFPCQDISLAGRGAGINGERSGLWKEMLRLVRELRPRWVLIENVPALRLRGGDVVLADLEEAGYAGWSFVVGAWAVGAPHRRDRVWIVAHNHDHGRDERAVGDSQMANAKCARRKKRRLGPQKYTGGELASGCWPARPNEHQHQWEESRLTQFSVGASVDGIPERLARRWNREALKACGNSVVPQIVAMIGWAILRTDSTLFSQKVR